jgi:hypothetical protein
MNRQTQNSSGPNDGDMLRFRAALTALPSDLASDVDRMMTYLRNHQAKQRIRIRLKQYSQQGQYRSDTPPTVS